MTLNISKELYPKEAIIKASYFFTDTFYITLDSDDKYYYVNMTSKTGNKKNDLTSEKEFMNEVLIQTTRYNIMMQTKDIRKLIVGRALASTIIDDSDTGFIDDENIDSTEILQNWFEKYDK